LTTTIKLPSGVMAAAELWRLKELTGSAEEAG
jgi:hypothetical protein